MLKQWPVHVVRHMGARFDFFFSCFEPKPTPGHISLGTGLKLCGRAPLVVRHVHATRLVCFCSCSFRCAGSGTASAPPATTATTGKTSCRPPRTAASKSSLRRPPPALAVRIIALRKCTNERAPGNSSGTAEASLTAGPHPFLPFRDRAPQSVIFRGFDDRICFADAMSDQTIVGSP